jgi:LmbE family N-acetylglucosaminyl deacetylase
MKPMRSVSHSFLVVIFALAASIIQAAEPDPNPPKQGAALLKTDLMGVFAHPDDETGLAATVAYYALGEDKVVAHVYATRGEGGGNMVGTQAGTSLGVLREAELRHCLKTLGVRYCYFLDEVDWAYTESLDATLRKWGHDACLGRLVRLFRCLRPEVVVTMNPAPSPGQHGQHQAAGVLATEAFDAAADPARFPEQLSKEGLSVWQVRKLYYRGASGTTIATIQTTGALPDGKTPAEIAAQALSNHRSQAFGNFGDSPWMRRPQTFTLVKSVVPFVETESDLFRGLPLPPATAPPTRLFPALPPEPEFSIRFVPRPAISRYQDWVRTERIGQVASQLPADVPVVAGEPNTVRLEVFNRSAKTASGRIEVGAPEGWTVAPSQIPYDVAAGGRSECRVKVRPPENASRDVELLATAHPRGGSSEGKARAGARAHPVPKLVVRRLRTAPSLDGTDAGWSEVPVEKITPEQRVQGTVTDEADSSARFRLGYDRDTLYVDVEVKDEKVVSNIAPNDIRGHWRSDSVEICFDPQAGSEDTLGCFKVGIFPFDTTGRVRGARDADAHQGPVEETAPGTRLVSKRTSDGYRIQAAIPFSEIGISPARGRRLGFNLIVYDGDKADAAPGENINESRIAWSPRSGVQGQPEDWGRIDLE